MKHLIRAGLCVAIVLLSVVSTRPQDSSLPGVPKRNFKHNAKIVSVYDQAKDQTVVVIDWSSIPEENISLPRVVAPQSFMMSPLQIKASFIYPGRVLTVSPKAVDLGMRVTQSGGYLFKGKEMPELIAMVDGERISLGRMSLERAWTQVEIAAGQVSGEELFARFTYQGLLRLVNSKKVEMQVGQLKFKLEDRHLEALRDLANRMVP